jgi:predicted ester cyclase
MLKEMLDDNKELVRRWVGVFNSQDFDGCAEIAAETYVEHALAPFGEASPGEVNGPKHLQEAAVWLLAQFPDLHMTIESMVSEDETVAVRILSEGNNLGPLNGVIPPTGRHFSARQSHWFRIRDGKLAEHWATRDDLTAMLQLGALQRPGPPPGAGGPPS